MITAGPAGALANECIEHMDPNGQGNASGLTVACTFLSGTDVGLNLTLEDAYSPLSPQLDPDGGGPLPPAPQPLGVASGALYHYGAARVVNVVASRIGAGAGTLSPTISIKTCANNDTIAAVSSAACPAPGAAPGNKAITTADINRSVEFATSSATLTGLFISPGTFIKNVVGTTVTLSKPLIAAGAPLCPAGDPSPCTSTVSAPVLVSHGTNRAVEDGDTTAGSAVVTSPTANFKPSDVGARLSGGDLPDGATILTVDSVTQVTLTCTACLVGFSGVTDDVNPLAISIDPKTPTTTTRYIADASLGGANNRTITSATARFNNNDIGLKVVTAPASPAGTRINTVISPTQATIIGGGAGALAVGGKKITLGVPTKTAPANGDVVGTLAISLVVNPVVSPTSPPCLAGKVSGFHIPWQWRNPGSYDLVNNNSTHVQGHSVAGTSIAQLLFLTASTSFAGFIKQNGTVASGVLTTTDYIFRIEFAPVAVGVCGGTPVAETLSFIGISVKQAQNPTFTGGGGGGTRALGPIPDGRSVEYTGSEGVNLVTQGSNPTDANTCVLNSPNQIGFPTGC